MTKPTIQEIIIKNLKNYTDLNHGQVIFIADQIFYDIEKFHNSSTGNKGVGSCKSTSNIPSKDNLWIKDWLTETIDMLLRTRSDPRKEENEHSVSEWAKSTATKKALRAHGVTYNELMIAYRKRRDGGDL